MKQITYKKHKMLFSNEEFENLKKEWKETLSFNK